MGYTEYFLSQKGAQAMRGMSMIVATFMTQFGIIVMLASVIRREEGGLIEKTRLEQYDIFMCSLSVLALIILLVLGYTGHLTLVHRKIRHKSFIRAGMLLLGSGGLVYHGARVIDFVSAAPECRGSVQTLVVVVAEMIFIMMTMAFLFMWCETEIVNNVWMAMFFRFLLALIISTTTLILASAIMEEALEQMHLLEEARSTGDSHGSDSGGYDEHDYESDIFQSSMWNHSYEDILNDTLLGLTGSNTSTDHMDSSEDDSVYDLCPNSNNLAYAVAMFTFPLLVEYGVVSFTILVMIWDEITHVRSTEVGGLNSKHGHHGGETTNHDDKHNRSSRMSCISSCKLHHYGVIFGWVMVLVTVVVSLKFLKELLGTQDDPSYWMTVRIAVHGESLVVAGIGVIAIPFAVFLLRPLSFRDHHIKKLQREREGAPEVKQGGSFGKVLDKGLLLVTNISLVSFKLLSILCAVDSSRLDAYMVVADGVTCIIMAYMQTMFINYYASYKVAKTSEQQASKPGNQGMYFLRCVNFSLWLINTLLLKHPRSKSMQIEYYGEYAWPLLTNIIQPLTILFYFHSFVFLSDVSTEAYLPEYVGLVRMEKRRGSEMGQSSNGLNRNQEQHEDANERSVYKL